VPLVLDLRITHDRVGSNTDPTLNGPFRYSNKLDQSLNDTTADKIRKYRDDDNNRTPNTVTTTGTWSGRDLGMHMCHITDLL
jgi:hypothetical protein